MHTTAPDLSETLQVLPARLRAELLRYLRCADEVRAEERGRYRSDPVMAPELEPDPTRRTCFVAQLSAVWSTM